MKKTVSLISLTLATTVLVGTAAASCTSAGSWTTKTTGMMKDHYLQCGKLHCTVTMSKDKITANVKRYIPVPIAQVVTPSYTATVDKSAGQAAACAAAAAAKK